MAMTDHYLTLDIEDSSWPRIQDYISLRSLECYIYYREPYYRICLVRCAHWDRVWLSLLV